MMKNKRVNSEAKQLLRWCRVDSSVNEDRVRQVVKQIVFSGRRNSHALLSQLLRLVRLDHDQHTATIESAIPLTPELKAATQARLNRLYGQGLNFVFLDRPSLIGGMRIQIGSDVYDGTVQSELAALEKCF